MRTNIELQKLGANGITVALRESGECLLSACLCEQVLISSGDNGAPGRGNNGFCELDPNVYCPLGGCDHNETACQGIELSVSYGCASLCRARVFDSDVRSAAKMTCILPLGLEGFGCAGLTSIVDIPNVLTDAFDALV
jgi:hypothetical protein